MPATKPSRGTAPDAEPNHASVSDGSGNEESDWQRRVVTRSLRDARQRSIDRGISLVRAAEAILQRSDTDDITVQEVADEAGQSLRTLYQYFESKEDLLLAVFEEAMQVYAELIRTSIRDLEDPLERLAGGIVAAARMSEVSGTGMDRSLARLRLRLGAYQPELIARSQLPLSNIFRELVGAARDANQITDIDTDGAAYFISTINGSFNITKLLGNDFGFGVPDTDAMCLFCLRGLHADVDKKWVRSVSRRVKLPAPAGKTSGRAAKK